MWQLVLIVALAGFLAGFACADFIATWKLHKWISTDAIFFSLLSMICVGGAIAIAHFPN